MHQSSLQALKIQHSQPRKEAPIAITCSSVNVRKEMIHTCKNPHQVSPPMLFTSTAHVVMYTYRILQARIHIFCTYGMKYGTPSETMEKEMEKIERQ